MKVKKKELSDGEGLVAMLEARHVIENALICFAGEGEKEADGQQSSDDQKEPDEKEKLTKIEDVELEKEEGEQNETKDVGKQDDQPPNAEDQKE